MSRREGTRQGQNFEYGRPETRLPNNKYTRDVGMSKRLTIAGVFSGSLISDDDATADFSVFDVGEQIIIWGSASNNGVRAILSVSSASLTVDFPVKTEGPTAGVEVRST